MSRTLRRRAAFRRGLRAEAAAAWYLRLKGYRILARRFRCPVGEVDIIAARGRLLCFVEVKARGDLDAAVFAVGGTGRRRIAAAALSWLSRRPDLSGHAWRFDIVAIRPWRLPVHIAAAFEPAR